MARTHRPEWRTPSSGGSREPQFCTRCGVRRGQPAAHPVHYAERMTVANSGGSYGWAIYCARYGEWTASHLTYATANAYAKAHEDGTEPCGCAA